MPFGLQPLDLIVIVVVALVIFGPKRLPQIGRWLGKTFSSFRKGARDLADGFADETRPKDATGTTPSDLTSPPGTAEVRCSACNAANPASARFCNQCGNHLAT
jgi:sec-independent protein translocase protein TatA